MNNKQNKNRDIISMEKEYIAKGGMYCPLCSSNQIEGTGEDDFDTDYASNEIVCLKCGTVWLDVYKLTGINIVSLGKLDDCNEVEYD